MSRKFVMQDHLWAGTESSLEAYLASAEAVSARMAAGPYDVDDDDDEDDDLPELLQIQNGVGVISIHGPLTNSDSPWNAFFGVTSYNAIREALMFAAGAPDVEAILLDINSGGGAVNGVDDAAKLISVVDKIKPVVSYTDGAMCSAAYWLGCSAREVYASNVAVVGSIGVIATHMERSKQLADNGVGVTVMRSGKYKALVNSVEPLTEEAKSQMQGQLDAVYSIFLNHVAASRGKSADYVDANMAQGREFLGQQVLSAGLADGIESFDSVMSMIQRRFIGASSQDNRSNFVQGNPTMKKQAMTEQDIAAIAAGIHVQAATETGNPATVVEEAATETEQVEAAVEHKEEVKADALVTYLQAEVKSKDAALLEAQIEVRDVKAKISAIEATHAGLLEIVKKSVGQMQIALGGSALDMSGLDAAAVLVEHARVGADFQKSFKAGGVSAVSIESAKQGSNREGVTPVNSVVQAQLNALRGK